MFKSFKEISRAYPIGSVYEEETIYPNIFIPNNEEGCKIIKELQNEFGDVWINDYYPKSFPIDRGRVYTYKTTLKKYVQGYYFDGEYWYPTYTNDDGIQLYKGD